MSLVAQTFLSVIRGALRDLSVYVLYLVAQTFLPVTKSFKIPDMLGQSFGLRRNDNVFPFCLLFFCFLTQKSHSLKKLAAAKQTVIILHFFQSRRAAVLAFYGVVLFLLQAL